ncbi:MAG: Transcriptional Coactivator p15 (PC4) [Syntrophorhabdus sp. PtaU1.Bin153]|nr:MAG: Transcriptional Coactivator p15 (PC4) [Syntrophorhabdus sp. PtaU1.Bin153]
MLIGKIATNTKHRLMVTIEDHKGTKVVDLRSYQIVNGGELVPTQDGISLNPEKVDAVIDLLRKAQKRIAGAGAN